VNNTGTKKGNVMK